MAEYKRPLPRATPETEPFWEAIRKHELHLQRCQDCGKAYFPPRPFCPNPSCSSSNVEWFRASGRGTLHSYVINHRPARGFEEVAPYAIAAVQLEEGPRMATNITGIGNTPDNLVLDMSLEIAFEDVTETDTIYTFQPAGEAS